eukprot:GEMP01095729.1.p1 GENE.GEMP01095729.1~~GEMP01095729.1.p1  ORF type:complete len:225 (+),score=27.47 GEMP01095729.1:50-676(+)
MFYVVGVVFAAALLHEDTSQEEAAREATARHAGSRPVQCIMRPDRACCFPLPSGNPSCWSGNSTYAHCCNKGRDGTKRADGSQSVLFRDTFSYLGGKFRQYLTFTFLRQGSLCAGKPLYRMNNPLHRAACVDKCADNIRCAFVGFSDGPVPLCYLYISCNNFITTSYGGTVLFYRTFNGAFAATFFSAHHAHYSHCCLNGIADDKVVR